MSTYLPEQIEKPPFFGIRPLMKGRGRRKVEVIGFDTEAEHGRPFLLQFNAGGTADDTVLIRLDRTDGHACLREFVRYIHDHCTRRDTEYVVFGWNLLYEFTQLFGHIPELDIVNTLPEFKIAYTLRDGSGNAVGLWTLHVMNDRRYAITMRNETTHVTVRVIDGMKYFPTSLDAAAQALGLGRKIAKPERFHSGLIDSPHFQAYAKQDAYLTRQVGIQIMAWHEEYDVPTCISAPHFAARVFRRHFLSQEIDLPFERLEFAGLASYHGGKNGYYLGAPKKLYGVWSYDITSAYPEAMRALPDLERSTWQHTDRYVPGVHGLYKVSGRYRRCRWRCLYTHGSGFAASGMVTDTWITSYELDTLIDHGEFDIDGIEGYILTGPPGGPLAEYVDRFFEQKRTATGALRIVAKLFLNSLYGKFFQKVPIRMLAQDFIDVFDGSEHPIEPVEDGTPQYRAGGLYHPPIASLITGYVRAKVHRLEHKYNAIHTSTDGFFALRPPDPADVGNDLGKLTVERGVLLIWRERLYAFKVGPKWSKYALHGFRGKLEDLLAIPLRADPYTYRAPVMVTLKLAQHRLGGERYDAGTFVDLPFTLDLSRNGP
jgi:hypothetical protein